MFVEIILTSLTASLLLILLIYILANYIYYKNLAKNLENLMLKLDSVNFDKIESDAARIYRISEKNLDYQNLFWEIDEIRLKIYKFHGDLTGKNYDYREDTKKKNIKRIKQEIKRAKEDEFKLNELINEFEEKSKNVVTNVRTLWNEFDIYHKELRYLHKYYYDSPENTEIFKNYSNEIEKLFDESFNHKTHFSEFVKQMDRKKALEEMFYFKEKIIKLANIFRYIFNFKDFADVNFHQAMKKHKTNIEKSIEKGIFLRNISTEDSISKIESLHQSLNESLKILDMKKSKESIKNIASLFDMTLFEILKEKTSSAMFLQKYPEFEKILVNMKSKYKKVLFETEKIEVERSRDPIENKSEKKLSMNELTSSHRNDVDNNFNEIETIISETQTEGITNLRKAHLLKNAFLLLKSINSSINLITKINFQNSNLSISNQKYFQNLERIYLENIYELKIKKVILDENEKNLKLLIEQQKSLFFDTLNILNESIDPENIATKVDNLFMHIKKFTKSVNLKLVKIFVIDDFLKENAHKRSGNYRWNDLAISLERHRLEGNYDEGIELITSFLDDKNSKRKVS
ncbi:hypothetical protein [[Mycoplasma] mobile]|uniref:Expressed protein n=1 Tax=Mycoplasma mobile (strain ATCC 43663 / 163K / NCTC 11711) TaxID=267748 RepID=Q6KIM0_MYCM1|nr:hypothetical protein [[Mycoplasma] mobile]AAT27556.1 expressed protein [Mycoplasma mobile 163K]